MQEAAGLFGIPDLDEAKKQMVVNAGMMMYIALICASFVKAWGDEADLMPLAGLVREWAESEKKVYGILKSI